jgi:drug/metabolite transporter (DMT)-like permease
VSSPATVEQPLFGLPTAQLGVVWGILIALAFLGWLVVGPAVGLDSSGTWAGLMGALVALVVGAGSILLIVPWRPRPSGDLPTLWLLITVGRLFVTPACALLLYFAARPPAGTYVLGIGSAYIALLVFETTVIVRDMRRQLETT